MRTGIFDYIDRHQINENSPLGVFIFRIIFRNHLAAQIFWLLMKRYGDFATFFRMLVISLF